MKPLMDRIAGLSDRDRDVLGSVFQGLEQRQEDLLAEIRKEVRESLKPGDPLRPAPEWKTVTALVRADGFRDGAENLHREILQDGLPVHREQMTAPLTPGAKECPEQMSAGFAFLLCRYSEIQDLLRKTYTAAVTSEDGGISREVPYRLRLTSQFLHEEEWLEYAAVRNGVLCPPLYSPMSRRAVEVCVDFPGEGALWQDRFRIDFRYEKNGLKGKLLSGVELVWNVKENSSAASSRETTEKQTPFGDQTYGVYEFFPKPNEFIRAQGTGWDVRRANGKVYINLRDGSRTVTPAFSCFMLQDVLGKASAMMGPFRNRFDCERMGRERIRTQADVTEVMTRFRPAGLEFLACHLQLGSLRPVKIYEQEHACHYPKSPRLRGRNTRCYLQVKEPESGEAKLFFEDLASYAAAYMNYFYPEFYWVVVT